MCSFGGVYPCGHNEALFVGQQFRGHDAGRITDPVNIDVEVILIKSRGIFL
jgi:hypothetical protein